MEGEVTEMQEVRTPAQEAAEDVFFGQVVIIWARWAIVLAGATIVVWAASTIGELTANMLLVLVLMAANFYLHGRYFMELPANRVLLLAASLLDLAIITLMVFTFSERPGLQSPYFVFYVPVLAAFAFVFPPRTTIGYTLATLVVYVGACFVVNPSAFADTMGIKTMVMRLIILGSMGLLGTYYWRIQRDRRRAGGGATQRSQARLDVRLGMGG
jgi:hypothetical protein